MARTIAIGKQDFEEIRKNDYFYIDKTGFISKWWENGDDVTLINRPRRFGKTLTMSMLNCFFSVEYKDRQELFEGLDIWKKEKYKNMQGTYPVIFLSFATVKEVSYQNAKKRIYDVITDLYNKNSFLLESGILTANEKDYYNRINPNMDEVDATAAINKMSNFLSRYYSKKVIILLDEYDTPMQEAYVYGYWNEASGFFRSLFNASFKTNNYMERSIITGITRISKESMFSDLNNPKVITTTSVDYATTFGFTEPEVFAAMKEYGLDDENNMKQWYDGFTFGNVTDIYNPWSVINVLKDRKYLPYWVNTSSNSLISKLLKEAGDDTKKKMETLIKGENIESVIDEEIIYTQLDNDAEAIWSLLLASGYLKVIKEGQYVDLPDGNVKKTPYILSLTNKEVRIMFNEMIKGWFGISKAEYNGFLKALLTDNVEYMNEYMNEIALKSFSSFDTSKSASKKDAPKRFYHGFVLGLMVELAGRYEIKSNRESGFGRYDIMLSPLNKENDKAYIIEFKVKKGKELSLEDTVKNALMQIDEKQYETELVSVGIPSENIRKYGFAFEGKKVLIG